MKIYTKTGDKGSTALFGGRRVAKDDLRIEAYGTVDELNSFIGLAVAQAPDSPLSSPLRDIAAHLFTLGADLATPLSPPPRYAIPRIDDSQINWLESMIDDYEESLPPLKSFIVPGGTALAAALHLARTVCRRAERRTVALAASEDIGSAPVRFLNRLSDYLFVAARYANFLAGEDDIPWRNPAAGQ